MKKITMVLFYLSNWIFAQNAWINEFHYDNAGTTDIGEFVEVAIENASDYDLDDFRLSFYSSTSGTRYDVYHKLSTFDVGITENNITLYSKMISGIQNGPNDGIALDYQNTVLQFISYEGILTASEGVADGITSVDVGVAEDNSTPAGYSIGLIGNGNNISSFTWVILEDDTPGNTNSNQILPVELTTFSASISENSINLNWETATEVNNYGFEVQRKYQESSIKNQNTSTKLSAGWEKVAFIAGSGNSNSNKNYNYSDNSISISGKYSYRLKQIDIDGKFEYSNTIEVEVGVPTKFEVVQNYPNPFNPSTTISFSIPERSEVIVQIYNMLGQSVYTLVNEELNAGKYNYNFDATNLSSGNYIYTVRAGNNVETRKMILLK